MPSSKRITATPCFADQLQHVIAEQPGQRIVCCRNNTSSFPVPGEEGRVLYVHRLYLIAAWGVEDRLGVLLKQNGDVWATSTVAQAPCNAASCACAHFKGIDIPFLGRHEQVVFCEDCLTPYTAAELRRLERVESLSVQSL